MPRTMLKRGKEQSVMFCCFNLSLSVHQDIAQHTLLAHLYLIRISEADLQSPFPRISERPEILRRANVLRWIEKSEHAPESKI